MKPKKKPEERKGTKIYILEHGFLEGNGVEYEFINAFRYPKSAERALRERKETDTYEHQYDRIVVRMLH